jgi:hypothetical protein
MKKLICFIVLAASTTFAGSFFKSCNYNENDIVVGAVNIVGKGAFNLVAVLEFNKTPYDDKIYSSTTTYHIFNTLIIEAKQIALKAILEKDSLRIQELKALQTTIENNINEMLATKLKKVFPGKDIKLPFGISMLYLDSPNKED